MTYEQDPPRWSESGNTDVPDVLRDLMRAGAQEVPSPATLAMLGAKVSAGATAASAAGTATSGALGTAKLWLAGAIGAAVIGAVAIQVAHPGDRGLESAPTAGPSAPALPEAATPSGPPGPGTTPATKSTGTQTAPLAAPAPAPLADRETLPEPRANSSESPDVVGQERTVAQPESEGAAAHPGGEQHAATAPSTALPTAAGEGGLSTSAGPTQVQPASPRGVATTPPERMSPTASGRVSPTAAAARPADTVKDEAPATRRPSGASAVSTPSDVQLLLEARKALTVSPQRALTLATRHAAAYPDSQFRQERDALVIEALTRSGQLDRARDEARSFVKRYPNSANAHRFRERLDL